MIELVQFLEKTVWVLVMLGGLLTGLAMKVAPSKGREIFHSYCKLVLNAFVCTVGTRLLDMALEVEGADTPPGADLHWYLTGLVFMACLVIGQYITKAPTPQDKQK